jgi:hypothetical protein
MFLFAFICVVVVGVATADEGRGLDGYVVRHYDNDMRFV